MAERSKTHDLLTVEEYLELEESSAVRHEYVGGMAHAMVGTTKRHNTIAGNIFANLWNRSRGGPCRVYASNVKVQAENTIYYPDVMVACGPSDGDPLIEHEPCLIVEVTSPGTESIDRREKMLNYRRIPSLRAYLIVDQERSWIERHWRDEDGAWRQGGLDAGAIPVPCPETRLPLEAVYEGL